MRGILLSIGLIWFLGCAFAQATPLRQCTDSDGRTTLRNTPCESGEADNQPTQSYETIPLLPLGIRGQYWVPTVINDQLEVNFLIDTGANIVVMPQDIIDQLVTLGSITPQDQMGVTAAKMADGSLGQHPMVRLNSLQIGHHTLQDIAVSVTPAKSMPLLGTPVLEQLGAWRIDHQQRHLTIPMTPRPTTEENQPKSVDTSQKESSKTMQQCWRTDGSTYLTQPPCPSESASIPPETRKEQLITQCRTTLTWIQQNVNKKPNPNQLQTRLNDYNQHCPGLIYQSDSGQAGVFKEVRILGDHK